MSVVWVACDYVPSIDSIVCMIYYISIQPPKNAGMKMLSKIPQYSSRGRRRTFNLLRRIPFQQLFMKTEIFSGDFFSENGLKWKNAITCCKKRSKPKWMRIIEKFVPRTFCSKSLCNEDVKIRPKCLALKLLENVKWEKVSNKYSCLWVLILHCCTHSNNNNINNDNNTISGEWINDTDQHPTLSKHWAKQKSSVNSKIRKILRLFL